MLRRAHLRDRTHAGMSRYWPHSGSIYLPRRRCQSRMATPNGSRIAYAESDFKTEYAFVPFVYEKSRSSGFLSCTDLLAKAVLIVAKAEVNTPSKLCRVGPNAVPTSASICREYIGTWELIVTRTPSP